MSKTHAIRVVSFSVAHLSSSEPSLPLCRLPLLYREGISRENDIAWVVQVTQTDKERRNILRPTSLPFAWLVCLPSNYIHLERDKERIYSNETLQSSPMGAPTLRTTANAALVLVPGV